MNFTTSIKNNYEFRRLYASGKTAATGLLAIYCKRSRGGTSRLGLTVGTKVGNAVVRNRVRRKLKEIYRLHEAEIARGWDIIIVARVRSRTAAYRELEADLLKLLGKMNLLDRQP